MQWPSSGSAWPFSGWRGRERQGEARARRKGLRAVGEGRHALICFWVDLVLDGHNFTKFNTYLYQTQPCYKQAAVAARPCKSSDSSRVSWSNSNHAREPSTTRTRCCSSSPRILAAQGGEGKREERSGARLIPQPSASGCHVCWPKALLTPMPRSRRPGWNHTHLHTHLKEVQALNRGENFPEIIVG